MLRFSFPTANLPSNSPTLVEQFLQFCTAVSSISFWSPVFYFSLHTLQIPSFDTTITFSVRYFPPLFHMDFRLSLFHSFNVVFHSCLHLSLSLSLFEGNPPFASIDCVAYTPRPSAFFPPSLSTSCLVVFFRMYPVHFISFFDLPAFIPCLQFHSSQSIAPLFPHSPINIPFPFLCVSRAHLRASLHLHIFFPFFSLWLFSQLLPRSSVQWLAFRYSVLYRILFLSFSLSDAWL